MLAETVGSYILCFDGRAKFRFLPRNVHSENCLLMLLSGLTSQKPSFLRVIRLGIEGHHREPPAAPAANRASRRSYRAPANRRNPRKFHTGV
jgi:hypothetical protein